MKERIGICYFSGTGNTEHVVKLARDAFVSLGHSVKLVKIEDLRCSKGKKFDPDKFSMLGIAHPVLGFDCPGFIYDFVRDLPCGDNKPVFFLKTAADYHAVNHSASHSIRKILMRKGYDTFYDEIIAMPVNWLISYDDQLNRQLVEVAPVRVEAAVRRILRRERRTLSNCLPFRVILKMVGYMEERHGARYFGRYLKADSSCIMCGKCAQNCPVANIEIKDEELVFGRKCVWCMRCIYNCPEKAIYNKYMNVFILKEGYSLERIRALDYEPIDYGKAGIPFWHRYFWRYFEEIQPDIRDD